MPKHKIMLVGECWGSEEERQKRSFVDSSGDGKMLRGLLHSAGIRREECFITDLFPFKSSLPDLVGPKKTAIPNTEPVFKGKYIRAEFSEHVGHLQELVKNIAPNVVVTLGGAATWALLGSARIAKVRGAVAMSPLGIKVIPTYHPNAVIRQYNLFTPTVFDLIKAKKESEFPELRKPRREIWIEPSVREIRLFKETYLDSARRISIDIETIGDQISCIGFAPSASIALVIPIIAHHKPENSYYSFEEEKLVWRLITEICANSADKVFQNGLYDAHFLLRRYGIAVKNFNHDTMLAHHSIMPESPKGLDYLGSLYTDEASWKLMRKSALSSTIKKDD